MVINGYCGLLVLLSVIVSYCELLWVIFGDSRTFADRDICGQRHLRTGTFAYRDICGQRHLRTGTFAYMYCCFNLGLVIFKILTENFCISSLIHLISKEYCKLHMFWGVIRRVLSI